MSATRPSKAPSTTGTPLEIRLLGPLVVSKGGESLPLGGRRPRALLALLSIQRGVVSRDRLVDELWGESPPATARHMVEVYVSKLRAVLGADVLVTRRPGYLVDVDPQHVDIGRFESLVAEGVEALAAGRAGTAATRLAQGLALWRGPPLADFTYEPFAQGEIARLQELRLLAEEERIDAELALGKAPELVGELEQLIARAPFRERLRGQLMLSLYRTGRQADALEVYRAARETFVEELAVEPGSELRALERAILRQDESLAREPPTRSRAYTDESRRIVTVLLAELAGGPETDLEALQRHKRWQLSTAQTVLEHHGAGVEHLADGTLMGVLGMSVAHEDDALRGLRAAVDLRGQRVIRRAAVETGEILAGEDRRVSGPTVRHAAGLLAATSAGEILVGQAARRLTAHAARFGSPAEVQAASAWPLLELTTDGSAHPLRLDVPLVGREVELDELRDTLARSVRDEEPRLVTVVGEAGIGKSRLVRAFADELEGRCVAVGRCLEYGQGITYWPLREIMLTLAGEDSAKAIAALVATEPDGDAVGRRLASAVGFASDAHPVEEISWAARRLFETWARERPLVLVVEDIHWAEPTFLDLLEQVVKGGERAPMLVLCLARPELLERRPGWSDFGERARSLRLEGLAPPDAEELVSRLDIGVLSGNRRRETVQMAEGNPLFLEQLVAFALDGTQSREDPDLPHSLRALLTARIDRLGPGERATLECAAVVGRRFSLDAVAELLPLDAAGALRRHLVSLGNKGLVEPVKSELPFEESLRFKHVLLRETVHRSMSKERRARLHEHLARWLIEQPAPASDEVIGHHLEQSVRYRVELGTVDDGVRWLGQRAADRLASAGRRALARGDIPAATNLLGRAVALLDEASRERLELLPDLVEARFSAGELDEAEALVDEGIAAAEIVGEERLSALAKVEKAWLKAAVDPRDWSDEALAEAERAVPVFDKFGDDSSLARTWEVVRGIQWLRGHLEASRTAAERGLLQAERAGDERQQGWHRLWWTAAAFFSLASLDEVDHEIEQDLLWARETGSLWLEAILVQAQGMQYAARGDMATGRELISRGTAMISDLGMRLFAASNVTVWIAYVTDDPVVTEATLRESLRALAESGEKGNLSTVAATLAEALYAQGRYREAEEMLSVSGAASAADDFVTQMLGLGTRAKLLARRGKWLAAEARAREAIALAAEADYVDLRAESFLALGEVLRLAGRSDESVDAVRTAVELWEAKGNVLFARRARALLDELRAVSSLRI